jgi:high-affinity nickel permease
MVCRPWFRGPIRLQNRDATSLLTKRQITVKNFKCVFQTIHKHFVLYVLFYLFKPFYTTVSKKKDVC